MLSRNAGCFKVCVSFNLSSQLRTPKHHDMGWKLLVSSFTFPFHRGSSIHGYSSPFSPLTHSWLAHRDGEGRGTLLPPQNLFLG